MSCCRMSSVRAGGILLILALFATVLPTVSAFNNGQAASLVLGQINFTSVTNAASASGMSLPTNIAIDPTSGKLWVADYNNNRVLRFASVTSLVSGAAAEGVLGQPNFTNTAGATLASWMRGPRAVAVDSAGRLWVVDTGNNRVLRFDNAASKLDGASADSVLGQTTFNNSAAATTQSGMSGPNGVVIDSAGSLWVADTTNNRVLRFDSAASKLNGANADGVLGQLNFTSIAGATTAGRMSTPAGVAVDNTGRLWVADAANNRVLRFDSAASKSNGASADGVLGQLNFTSAGVATTASTMNAPSNVAIGSPSTLWVADESNQRALRFDSAASKLNGADADGVLGQPNFTSSTAATMANGLFSPEGMAVDSVGNLWIADSNNRRVLRFDKLVMPTLTWANPAAIAYGTALSNTQLNATANVAGSFSYTPGVGTVLNVGAGQTLSVLFTPTDNAHYSTATKTVLIDVTSPSQTITFGALANKLVTDPAFGMSATASSGLAVSFSSTTPAVCTVSGSTVTLVAAGTCTIAADQAGNASYSPAPQVSQSFTVSKISQTITFGALANTTYGDAPFSISATASSGLTVMFSSSTPAVCTVSGSTVTLVAAGTCTIAADQPGDASYNAAPQVSQSFTVNPAALTITADDKVKHVGTANPALTASYTGFVNGDSVGSLTPPVSLTTTATTGSAAGDYPISASGAINPNYTISFVAGTLTVTNKQVPIITWANPTAITYGTALSATQLNATASVPGTFSYTPAAGTLLNAGNSQALSVAFTPTDINTYVVTSATTHIDVSPSPQTITFGALAAKAVGDTPFSLSASASSGLLVTFSSATPTVCTVSGGTVTLVAAGTCTITAAQAGNANYSAAASVTRSFTVQLAGNATQFPLYLPMIMR